MIWTISNIISFIRLLLTVPLAFTIAEKHSAGFIIICLIALFSDYLDGFTARKLNQISELGKIIDPLADKVMIGVSVVMMTIYGYIPLWFVVIVLLRDLIIFLTGIFITRKIGYVLPSNMAGKVAVNFISGYLLLSFFMQNFITEFLLWASVISMAISFYQYFLRAYNLVFKKNSIS